MKKYILLTSGITLMLITIFLFINEDNRAINQSVENKAIMQNNTLTMMYETEEQSGEYIVSKDTSWPQDGYIFNETLSACENGSVLTWDDENKKVLMQASLSDRCYVYFDKYRLPKVLTQDNSIQTAIDKYGFTFLVSEGTNPIAKYFYKFGAEDGEFTEIDSATILPLTPGAKTIQFYVVDTLGYKSNVVTIQVVVNPSPAQPDPTDPEDPNPTPTSVANDYK